MTHGALAQFCAERGGGFLMSAHFTGARRLRKFQLQFFDLLIQR